MTTIQTIKSALQNLDGQCKEADVKRALIALGIKPLRNKTMEKVQGFELDVDERTYKGCTTWKRIVVEIFAGESSEVSPTEYRYKIKHVNL